MRKINLAIIDSGVSKNHPAFRNDRIEIKNIDSESEIYEDNDGHGTAIYGILRKCSELSIHNVKVNNIEKGITTDKLIQALKYVMDNIPEIDIINLSLGVNTLENDELSTICADIVEKGVIIVAAFDNSNSISYPAAFKNVIGVISDPLCKKTTDFVYIEDNVINLAAKGELQRVCWSHPDYIMIAGSSFACAHVTTQVAKFMLQGVRGRDQILKEFKKISIATTFINNDFRRKENLFSIKKAVLFPFNKEMHSLIRFYHMLPFEITGVYDIKYSPTVGATTAHLLKDPCIKDIMVKNINELEIDQFDTMILGHTNEIQQLEPVHTK